MSENNIVIGSKNTLCEPRPEKVIQTTETDWNRLGEMINDIKEPKYNYSNIYSGAFAFAASTLIPLIEYIFRDGNNKPVGYLWFVILCLVVSLVIGGLFYFFSIEQGNQESSSRQIIKKELNRLKQKNIMEENR